MDDSLDRCPNIAGRPPSRHARFDLAPNCRTFCWGQRKRSRIAKPRCYPPSHRREGIQNDSYSCAFSLHPVRLIRCKQPSLRPSFPGPTALPKPNWTLHADRDLDGEMGVKIGSDVRTTSHMHVNCTPAPHHVPSFPRHGHGARRLGLDWACGTTIDQATHCSLDANFSKPRPGLTDCQFVAGSFKLHASQSAILARENPMKASDSIPAARRPVLNRGRVNYWANILALATSIVVFATGLILLTQFHMGEGALNNFALGASRLTWVNIHRLTALALSCAAGLHAYLHWHTLIARVRRIRGHLPGGASRADPILYFGFAVEIITGLAAWFVLPGSPALLGPIRRTHLEPARHLCIDLHHLTGLILLPAAVIHVRRHFDWLLRAIGFNRTTAIRPRTRSRVNA